MRNHPFRAAAVFAGCLLLVLLLPSVSMLLRFGGFFFAAQLVFPYDHLVVREEYYSRAVFNDQLALFLTVLQWGLVGIGFAWFARRLSMGRMVLSAIAVILVVSILAHAIFPLFGVRVELDGL